VASKECVAALRRRITGAELSPAPTELMIFGEASVEHLERAAELEPENPVRLATALMWGALATAREKHVSVESLGKQALWEVLPESRRRTIEKGLARLGGFEESAVAGAAAQAEGVLRFVLKNDLRGAAERLRKAIGFVQESEMLWEALSVVLTRAQDFYELAAIAQARTLVRPSVRNRVLLAGAFEKLGHDARAIEELNRALALNGNDFAANLSLANLLMREPGISPRVRPALVNAERALRANGSANDLLALALTQSIYHGLNDEPERARAILKAAQAYAKDDPAIAAALNAVGY
jgi:tetratricopeptide (TPR) repeat protein